MSKKVFRPAKEELIEQYSKEGCTISSLAVAYGTSNPTVRSWLVFYDIPRKSQKQASTEANSKHRQKIKPSKKELASLYSENSIDSLESYYNVGQQTIYDWLDEHSIEKRSLSESCKIGKERLYKNIQFDKEFLETNYDRTKPVTNLADSLGVSRSHILKLFSIHNIELAKLEPKYRSNAEIELYEFLLSEFPNDKWICNDKSIINPYELDIVNEDKKIAIEYCGLYWHAEISSGKSKKYHKTKYDMCKSKGYKLITVFESDDKEKIRTLLVKLLGKTNKIYARKTKINRIDSKIARKFHEDHHLHGSIGGLYHYGLFHESELVMVGSFSKNRFSNKYQYECARMTSGNITVVGGASKIFKHFIREVNPETLVTFADLRFGDGATYLNCDMIKENNTAPNYWYFKKNTLKLFSRVKFQKHKLSSQLEFFDPDKTEFENMIDNKWDRIWDCGNAKYTYKKGGAEAPPS